MKGASKEFTTDPCEWREITELSDKQQNENNKSMWNHILKGRAAMMSQLNEIWGKLENFKIHRNLQNGLSI